jgi:flavin reductase (DIM6/NTAB) family NADH-FMN oxidoreductase RutF
MINFSAVIVLAATIVIIVTRGELGRVKAATASESGSRG